MAGERHVGDIISSQELAARLGRGRVGGVTLKNPFDIQIVFEHCGYGKKDIVSGKLSAVRGPALILGSPDPSIPPWSNVIGGEIQVTKEILKGIKRADRQERWDRLFAILFK